MQSTDRYIDPRLVDFCRALREPSLLNVAASSIGAPLHDVSITTLRWPVAPAANEP